MPLFRIFLLLLPLLFAGCHNDSRPRVEERLREIGVDQLRLDAAVLYKQQFATHTLDFISLRPKNWPDSFRKFSPLGVGLYPDGVTISIDVRSLGESGLYIVPRSMDKLPSNTTETTFEKMAEGIYWYTFRN